MAPQEQDCPALAVTLDGNLCQHLPVTLVPLCASNAQPQELCYQECFDLQLDQVPPRPQRTFFPHGYEGHIGWVPAVGALDCIAVGSRC